MFSLQELSLSYGIRTLFDNVSLTLNQGVRYGLVGANGCGKSSFLKILSGDLTPSHGKFLKPKNAKVGILRQDYYLFEKDAIINVVMMGKKELWDLFQKKETLLSKETLEESDLFLLDDFETKIEQLGGYIAQSQASSLLEGLGIAEKRHFDPLGSLSGGYKIRVLLAQLLFNEPDLLLLDEPTNYLDIGSIAWFGNHLKSFKGCAVVCSHDRAFLNDVATEILDIDYEKIKNYKGDYEYFCEQKIQDLLLKESSEKQLEKKEKHLETFVTRFGAKATKAAQAQSKMKLIEKIQLEKKAFEQASTSRRYPSFHFQDPTRVPAIVLQVEELEKAYLTKQVLNSLSFEVECNDKIAIVGPNGVGKSTLLEILTSHVMQDRGRVKWSPQIKWGYFPQHFEKELHEHKGLIDYLHFHFPRESEEKIRRVLGQVLFSKDDILKSINQLSGGEKARAVIARLMLSQFSVLIMDEPTNHLDLEACDSLVEAITAFEGVVILVSHQRHFIAQLATRIFEITPQGFYDFKGSYQEYVDKRGLDFLTAKDFKNASKPISKEPQKKDEEVSKNKRLDKEISKLETMCENKESELSKINAEINVEGFYEKIESHRWNEISEKIQRLEKEIQECYEKLEKLYKQRDFF